MTRKSNSNGYRLLFCICTCVQSAGLQAIARALAKSSNAHGIRSSAGTCISEVTALSLARAGGQLQLMYPVSLHVLHASPELAPLLERLLAGGSIFCGGCISLLARVQRQGVPGSFEAALPAEEPAQRARVVSRHERSGLCIQLRRRQKMHAEGLQAPDCHRAQ